MAQTYVDGNQFNIIAKQNISTPTPTVRQRYGASDIHIALAPFHWASSTGGFGT